MRIFLILAVACTAMAQTKPAAQAKPVPAAQTKKSALDKATLEAYVRHLGVWGPQIKVEIGDPKPSADLPGFLEVKVHAAAGSNYSDEVFLVSKDGQKVMRPPVYDIAGNPFKKEIEKLKPVDGWPAFGTSGAPVAIVVFSDFQCPFCREEAKALRTEMVKEYPTQVRTYFRDFPLEAIHPWAKAAAMAGRCVYRQKPEAFWDFHDWIFDKQSEMTAENLKGKVLEWAKGKDIETLGLGRCLDTKATEAEVDKSAAAARDLNVDRTPYLFVNGRRVPGATWQSLKQIIDFELEYQKTAKNAGDEACCTLSLPSPVRK